MQIRIAEEEKMKSRIAEQIRLTEQRKNGKN
jgi:hypothetical protein